MSIRYRSNTTKKKVTKVHNNIKKYYKNFTLEECLIIGQMWDYEKIIKITKRKENKKLWSEIKAHFKKNRFGRLKKFKQYSQPEITIAQAVYKFLKQAENKGYKLNKPLSIKELEELTQITKLPSILYSIKCYILANKTQKQIHNFNGRQSNTKPVKTYCKHHLPKDNSVDKHTQQCGYIAARDGVYPIYVNTAMYLKGCKILEK